MTQREQLTDEQIIRAFNLLEERIKWVGQNMIQLGLIQEYTNEKLMAVTDSNNDPLIPLDFEDEFQNFCIRRGKEIDNEMEQIKAAAQAGRPVPPVNLEDEDDS